MAIMNLDGKVSELPNQQTDHIAKKDVDEIMDFIEGNKNIVNEKKRMKKERQKQQRLEELRAKQEEEKRRKEAEELARKKREQEEREAAEAAEKAAKKMKKKANQKAKKLAAKGITTPTEEPTPSLAPTEKGKKEKGMDLEALHYKHIQEQKELLEKQKQELIEQQRMLDLQLKINFPAKVSGNNKATPSTVAPSATSKKAAKKAAKAAAASLAASRSSNIAASLNMPEVTVQAIPPPPTYPSSHAPPSAFYPPPYGGGGMVPPAHQQRHPLFPQHQAGAMPYLPGGPGMGMPPPGAGYHAPPPHLMQPHFTPGFSPPVNPGSHMNPVSSNGDSKPASSNSGKPGQPMVTIKRVMRPDTNEPTVTISVKKEDINNGGGTPGDNNSSKNQAQDNKEKVLFTLINGQVMKTSHAPENLIPSAKPLPRDLARQVLPEELQEATLTKKQRRKLKKKSNTAASQDGGEDDQPLLLDSAPFSRSPANPPPVPPNFAAKIAPNFGVKLPQDGSSGSSNGAAVNRVPLTADGRVDLQRLSLPEGISISKISGPVPERKYFPSKPAPESDTNSMFWPHQQPGFKSYTNMPTVPINTAGFAASSAPAASFAANPGVAATSGGNTADDAAMFAANDPNVIVVDTNKLPTREEEEKAKAAAAKKTANGGKKKAKTPPLDNSKNDSSANMLPGGAVEYTPGKPLPSLPANNSGNGQVLIKSINGKVVITPVPSTTPSALPPQNAAVLPPPAVNSVPPPAATVLSGDPKATVMNGFAGTKGSNMTSFHNQVTNGVNNTDDDITTTDGASANAAESGGEDSAASNLAAKAKKKKKKKRNAEDNLHEINSVFAPRDGLDLSSGDMDATDRDIEMFKRFCQQSVPLQNRAKVNLDLKSIKKKD
eukprot:TRINITY_DN4444_c1_g1_i1.p1 TRINITY_DN4444_c1_g1~~TRINITY_DN4444_c1_g1_i1.p1  ORF type:complete len:977 (-),score=309.52 TRINITY_DN4444_c1_g1_i1:209-2866(-)